MRPSWIHHYEQGREQGDWPALCHTDIVNPGKWVQSIYSAWIDGQDMVTPQRENNYENKQTNKQTRLLKKGGVCAQIDPGQ